RGRYGGRCDLNCIGLSQTQGEIARPAWREVGPTVVNRFSNGGAIGYNPIDPPGAGRERGEMAQSGRLIGLLATVVLMLAGWTGARAQEPGTKPETQSLAQQTPAAQTAG